MYAYTDNVTQVAWLSLVLIGLARILGLRRWWLIALVLPVLLLYALLTGGSPSIWRATIAGLCVAWALLLGRDVDGLSLWSLALALLLVIDPIQIFSISLQLTFAATWGLIVLAPAIRRLLERYFALSPSSVPVAATPLLPTLGGHSTQPTGTRPTALMQLLTLSLGAQIATMPLLLYHFGRLSPAGIGANFLAVPFAGILVGTGITGLFWSPMNTLNYPLTRAIAGIATLASRAPGAQTQTSPVPLHGMLLLYIGLLLMAGLPLFSSYCDWRVITGEVKRWWAKQRVSLSSFPIIKWSTVLLLAGTAYILWATLFPQSRWLRIALLDVGQGEAIVIHAPNGRTVLIDGGSSPGERRGEVGRAIIVPYLQSIGVRQIDALVITHADADHCSALPAVISELPVGIALEGGTSSTALHRTDALRFDSGHKLEDATAYSEVLEALQQRSITIRPAVPGQKLNLGDGITLTVLAPTEPPLQGGNNNSVVLRLDYGTTSALFTGDIEHEAEERLVRRGADLHCTILKLPHHGSSTGTSPLLLDAARPEQAILSCGRYNKFGHPAAEVLQRLVQRGIKVHRTDRDGAIEILSDGRQYSVQTFR